MILSWLTSAGNNIVDKTKNPFLGTFTLVWLARNWELVFALFNFDKTYSLEKKIEFLSERIQYDTFWTKVGYNILWTFIVLILTYLLINIARVISNLFEKRLTPIIYKWTDFKSLVPKSEYQGVLTRMNDLQERLDKEVQERIRLQNERDGLEEETNKLNLEIIELRNKEVESEKSTSRKLFKDDEDVESNKILESIIEEHGEQNLTSVLKAIVNKRGLSNSENLVIAEDLAFKGMIDYEKLTPSGKMYKVTDLGRMLMQKLM